MGREREDEERATKCIFVKFFERHKFGVHGESTGRLDDR